MFKKGTRVRWKSSRDSFVVNFLKRYYPDPEMMVIDINHDHHEPCVVLIGADGNFLRAPWLGPDEPEGFMGRVSWFSVNYLEICE